MTQPFWTVAWDASHNAFSRAVIGSLSVQDRQIVFKSANGLYSWRMDLTDVRSVVASSDYAKESGAIVIENMAGLRRYVAVLDEFRFGSPEQLVKPVGLAVRQHQSAALIAARDERDKR